MYTQLTILKNRFTMLKKHQFKENNSNSFSNAESIKTMSEVPLRKNITTLLKTNSKRKALDLIEYSFVKFLENLFCLEYIPI